jgi:hypothetical protein
MKLSFAVSPENMEFSRLKDILASADQVFTESKPLFSWAGSRYFQRKIVGITYDIRLKNDNISIQSKQSNWLGWVLVLLAIMWSGANGYRIGALIALGAFYIGDFALNAFHENKIQKGMNEVSNDLSEILNKHGYSLQAIKKIE